MARDNSKNVLISIMKEVNLLPHLQKELLHFAESKTPFPYVPKQLLEPEVAIKDEENTKILKLPSRPIQRSKYKIEEAGLYEREKYRPNPSKTRPVKEKERLQNMMAYGKDMDEDCTGTKKEIVEPITLTPNELFDEILSEIREREDFLDDMAELGEEKKYSAQIQCQIALRLKELEKLDKRRAEKISSQYRF